MLHVLGSQQKVCDKTTRRQLLQAGGAGLLGLTVPRLLAAEEVQPLATRRAKSVIFLFLFGGPSQFETFDMKPDAPSDLRGPYSPIASRTPGLRICEHLPLTASVSDKFCVIRNMSHPVNSHQGGSYYIQTGHRPPSPESVVPTPGDRPSLGSLVEYLSQRSGSRVGQPLPHYFVVPNYLGRLHVGGHWRFPGEYAGWLGRPYDPMTTVVDKKNEQDNPYYRACSDAELTFQLQGQTNGGGLALDRSNRRQSLLGQFDAQRRVADQIDAYQDFDKLQRRALSLVTDGGINRTLDIRRESQKLRDRYGRNLFGQSTLMARRLVEAGVRFATVHWDQVDGYNWDSHRSNHYLEKYLLPGLDQALSALLIDLDDRGLLDETLVVCLGEMGRTPRPNKQWGRDHWSNLFPAIVAGGGIRGGTLYGKSDSTASAPDGTPTTPEDLAATIYHALGINPAIQVNDPLGRPTPLVTDGNPLVELFG
ncbi:MAG: hypothetical protein CMJ70_17290 [Planctomycetaceae bacterium]|nr:hypothetical protein [Planctomycetaceae bacterium]|tara:strand:+ start:154 stop:1587 length:1434 start_codon:yes stop_codon:yes gene_type:complete